MSARKNQNGYMYNDNVRSDAAIAVLTKNATETDSKGTLACALPWGYGWGWVTLPNGVWSGGELSLYYVQNQKIREQFSYRKFLCLCMSFACIYILLCSTFVLYTHVFIHTFAKVRIFEKKEEVVGVNSDTTFQRVLYANEVSVR